MQNNPLLSSPAPLQVPDASATEALAATPTEDALFAARSTAMAEAIVQALNQAVLRDDRPPKG